MKKEYYREYFDLERNHWWFLARRKILVDYIRSNLNLKAASILNVGVATGATSEWLAEFGEVTSLEYEKECIQFTRGRTDLKIDHGSVMDLDYADASFDLITAFDVIEHVENDILALEEMVRVAKRGADLLFTVPAFKFLWSDHDVVNHHFRRYTLPAIKHLVTSNENVDLVFCSYFNYRLFPVISGARIAQKFVSLFSKSSPTSDFERYNTSWISTTLEKVMAGESKTISSRSSYPYGVSIVVHARKRD